MEIAERGLGTKRGRNTEYGLQIVARAKPSALGIYLGTRMIRNLHVATIASSRCSPMDESIQHSTDRKRVKNVDSIDVC